MPFFLSASPLRGKEPSSGSLETEAELVLENERLKSALSQAEHDLRVAAGAPVVGASVVHRLLVCVVVRIRRVAHGEQPSARA